VTANGPTPLERAPHDLAPGFELWLKREDIHELGSFKWRGALPVLEELSDRGTTEVVTVSTGNHGAATAWAATRLGLRAVVHVPEGASGAKLALLEELGADVRVGGVDLDEAKELAVAAAEAPFFEDGAERAQYEGYRAIAAEILDQLDTPPAAVVVPVGNGALLGGIGLEICARSPDTARIGAVPAAAPVMAQSLEVGEPVPCDRGETFADGLAVRVAIPLAIAVLGEVATRLVLVSERAIARGVGRYASAGIRAEGAAGAGLAALDELELPDGPVVVIVTGCNIDDEVHARAVERPETFSEAR